MDRDSPPGTYKVDIDEEALDSMALLGYRRTATRIWLRYGARTELLTIDRANLDAALAQDVANV
jgi:hypothetical protein